MLHLRSSHEPARSQIPSGLGGAPSLWPRCRCLLRQPAHPVHAVEEAGGNPWRDTHRAQPAPGLILTPVGESIVAQAGAVLRSVDQLQRLADEHRDPLGRRLSLGADSDCGALLAPLGARASAPGVSQTEAADHRGPDREDHPDAAGRGARCGRPGFAAAGGGLGTSPDLR